MPAAALTLSSLRDPLRKPLRSESLRHVDCRSACARRPRCLALCGCRSQMRRSPEPRDRTGFVLLGYHYFPLLTQVL